MIKLTADAIVEMMRERHGSGYRLTQAQVDIIDGIVEHQHHLRPHGILDNRFRTMHFLSQALHETDHAKTLTEYASGQSYEGRTDLGNTQPGDGPRFKGRGVFQLTGRHNYRRVGEKIGVNLEANPGRAAEPEISVQTAGHYWTSRRINLVSDDDERWNVERVTKLINGGYNGFQDRLAYFMAAGLVDWAEDGDVQPPEYVTIRLTRQCALELKAALKDVE